MSIDFEREFEKHIDDQDPKKAASAKAALYSLQAWRLSYGELPVKVIPLSATDEVKAVPETSKPSADEILANIDSSLYPELFKDVTTDNMANKINSAVGRYLPGSVKLIDLYRFVRKDEVDLALNKWWELMQVLNTPEHYPIINFIRRSLAVVIKYRVDNDGELVSVIHDLDGLRQKSFDELLDIRRIGPKSAYFLTEAFRVPEEKRD